MTTPDFPKEIVAAVVAAIVGICVALGVELSPETEQVLIAVIGGVATIAIAVAGYVRRGRAQNADKIAEAKRLLANPKVMTEDEFSTEPITSGRIFDDEPGLDRGTSRMR